MKLLDIENYKNKSLNSYKNKDYSFFNEFQIFKISF